MHRQKVRLKHTQHIVKEAIVASEFLLLFDIWLLLLVLFHLSSVFLNELIIQCCLSCFSQRL